jgi:tetratricopeptide (TPR) repeat protein
MPIRNKTGSVTEPRRALQHFTNRKKSIRHFAGYLNGDPVPEKILFFHGDGGNGKTILLRFLKEKCCKRLNADNWGHVKSLEGDEFIDNFAGAVDCAEVPSTLIDFGMEPRGEYRPKEAFSALMKMRRDLSGSGLRFLLYDFASILYLHKTGRLTPDKQKEFFPSEEMDFVKETMDVIKEVPGAGLAKAVFSLFNKRLRDKFTLYMSARKIDEEQVQEMKSMDPESDLYGLFPTLFAEDLNASMMLQGAPQRVVLFFDTHDAFWEPYERKSSDEKYFLGDEWLRRILSTLEFSRGIVTVVAGREEPRWAEASRENIPAQYIDAYLVGGLSFADAALYLEKVEILDQRMKESLTAYAQIMPDEVHPLYLGLCADIVLAAKHSGKEITVEEFREIPDVASKGKELMSRLRKYVDRPTGYAISALSACRSFDRDLYVSLMDGLNPDFSREGFDYLTEFSFVWDSEDGGEGWYRVHDLMRRLAYEQKDPTTIKAHEVLTQYYRSRGEQGDITAIAERVYHAHRLDLEDGVNQWLTEMNQALSLSRYDLCRALLAIRNELFLPDDFSRGCVSAQEGDYYSALSIHQNALIEYQEAIAAFDEELRRAPDDVYVHNNKGNVLASLGNLQTGLAQHDEALRSYAQAIASFDQALRRDPDHASTYNNKGTALESLGELQGGLSRHDEASRSYAQAVAAYNEALRRAPDHTPGYNNKGNALQCLGKLQARLSQHNEASRSYAQAVAAYDEALRRAPDYVAGHGNKGSALQSLGKLQAELARHDEALRSYAEAIEAFDEALRIAPDDVAAHNHKGLTLQNLGDLQAKLSQQDEAMQNYKLAVTAYSRSLEIAPAQEQIRKLRDSIQQILDKKRIL